MEEKFRQQQEERIRKITEYKENYADGIDLSELLLGQTELKSSKRPPRPG